MAAHGSRGSKVIPVLLAKGERTRARVSGAEISFKRLTPRGPARAGPALGDVATGGMMYRFGAERGAPAQHTHPHRRTPRSTGADARSFGACQCGNTYFIR